MLDAISHIALIVSDPARTAALFERLFSVEVVPRTDAEGHDEIYFNLGKTWFLLAKGGAGRERTGDHVAFRATREVLEATADKLGQMNLEFIRARSDSSLYFFD